LPATRSGGEDKKLIEEQICSEVDLKEKRERGRSENRERRLKQFACCVFWCFAGHRRRGGEEERKS
jgi:hypothetical protein